MKKSVGEWTRLLDSADAATRRAYVGMYGATVHPDLDHLRPVFLRALTDPDFGVRLAAAQVVINNRSYAEEERARAVEILGEGLERPEPRYRYQAVYSFWGAPERAVPVLPRLARVAGRVQDGDEWRFVTETFRRLGAGAEPAAGELTDLLGSDNLRSKARAATLLALIGGPARPAVPALLKVLHEDDCDAVITAHRALLEIDPKALPRPSPAARFVPDEVATFKGRDFEGGLRALERLSQIGPDAVEAIPEILRFCDRFLKAEPKGEMRGLVLAVSITRERFGDALIPALLGQVSDDQPDIARLACIFVGDGRAGNADAIPAMRSLLARTKGTVKGGVAEALGSIGREDPRVTAPLAQTLKDPDAKARLGALKGLMVQEHPTQEALEAVEEATKDVDQEVRGMASVVLKILRAP
jgi:HEAT repeat protein